MQPIIVERGYTVEVPVSLAFNMSEDVLECWIRADPDPESDPIAQWEITFITDGTDGELLLTLPGEVTEVIVAESGYMFLRSFSDIEPIDIFDSPLDVVFVDP